MAQFYYFVCSLPMLSFGEELPMSSAEFVHRCADWTSQADLLKLNSLALIPGECPSGHSEGSIHKIWSDWDISLRNRIAEYRSGKIQRDASEYIREYPDFFSEIEGTVQELATVSDPLSIEKRLDMLRWRKLDWMEAGHEFDFDRLCIYKLKLMILEKWQEREEIRGQENLSELINKIYT